MPFVVRNRHRTYYEVSGRDHRAPTLVMIRGLSRSSRYWLDVRELVERDFRVVVLDNRGVGRSDAPSPGFRVEDMGDDVAAVMDDAGIARAHVFGISLGGMVALRFALRHAPRVDRLVLGATTAGGKDRVPVPTHVVRSFLATARMSVADAIRSTARHTLSADFLARRPDVVDRWVSLAGEEPRHRLALLGQLLAAARHDAAGELHRVASPTLVLTGDADTLIDPENSRQLARGIPGSRLEILPGAGHDFPTEQPAETAAAIARFLA